MASIVLVGLLYSIVELYLDDVLVYETSEDELLQRLSTVFTKASYTPMKVLNIDTIGPVDRDSADNCYILGVIDCFTRFVELYPVSDTSALPCARALLSHVFSFWHSYDDPFRQGNTIRQRDHQRAT